MPPDDPAPSVADPAEPGWFVNVAYGFPFHEAPPSPDLLVGATLVDLAQLAEQAGFSAAWLTEHPAPAQSWREQGGHDALDPFVGLALVAAATSTLRLLTYLAVVPYRNPFLLAKSVASLDTLSGGRFELGMGAGYLKTEFRALGVDFDQRNALFDQALEVMKLAWTAEPVNFDGLGLSARNVTAFPPPAQQPHPRLWFGGNSQLTMRRVVEHGAGWMPLVNSKASARHLRSPVMESIEDLARLLGQLRDHAERAGRTEPIEIMYWLPRVRDASEMKAHLDLASQAAELGVTWLVVNGEGTTADTARMFVSEYHHHVLQHLVA
jgi:probable F420-dependent oxidoreductase